MSKHWEDRLVAVVRCDRAGCENEVSPMDLYSDLRSYGRFCSKTCCRIVAGAIDQKRVRDEDRGFAAAREGIRLCDGEGQCHDLGYTEENAVRWADADEWREGRECEPSPQS